MTTPTNTPDVRAIAGRLTKEQREAAGLFVAEWQAGPTLCDEALDAIQGFRDLGIIEREFGDMGPATTTTSSDGFTANLSACWWFRLSPLGEQVRTHLQEAGDE